MKPEIKLYGTERCHKTQYYITFFKDRKLDFKFLDVEANSDFAEELRNLYTNRELNFPTIMINTKKLRNPSEQALLNGLDK